MEITAFNRLEEKIEGLLGRLEDYRNQVTRLKEQLAQKDKEIEELNQLLAEQDQERTEVRQRIEQLVLKLESY